MSIKSIIQRMMQRRIDAVKHCKRSAKHDRFRREAERYLDEVLAPELGLSDARLLGRTWRTMKYKARMNDRNVFVKITHKRQLRYLRRYLQAHDLLANAGIEIPEIIDSRTEVRTAKGRRLGALVLGWIDAPMWDIENLAQGKLAFANLARIHRIDAGPRLDSRKTSSKSALDPIKPAGLLDTVKSVLLEISWDLRANDLGEMRRDADPIDPALVRRITDFFETKIADLIDEMEVPSLLHMDYSPGNLMWVEEGDDAGDVEPKGRVVTLDFEGARKGPFCFDLAHALFCLATDSHRIAEADLSNLLDPGRFEPWLAAYFDALPAEKRNRTRDIWNRHARVVLLWTYLKYTGSRFKKSRDRFRFGWFERRKFSREGLMMWNKFNIGLEPLMRDRPPS